MTDRTLRRYPQGGLFRRAGHPDGCRSGTPASGARPLIPTLLAALSVLVLGSVQAPAQTTAFLVAQQPTSHPPGSASLCQRYAWACARSGQSRLGDAADYRLARKINLQVNRRTRHVADETQYGVEEHWALPTARGGDCEDVVLLKKKRLLEAGVAPEALLIATVLDKKMNSHAVLVLRTRGGDFVLDNLTNRILPWHETGYTFLKVQNPAAPAKWDAVMAGGIISERPTASN